MTLPPLKTVTRETALEVTPGPAAAVTPGPARTVTAPVPPVASALDGAKLTPEVRGFFAELLHAGLLTPTEAAGLLVKLGDRLPQLTTRDLAADALVGHGFLTRYQAERAQAGQSYGLVLGNYRLLERINGGTVGIVFLGEHVAMKRRVAVKVLPADATVSAGTIARFRAEVRLLASITHPHVVTAYDAGVLPAAAPGQADLHYLVLELVTGGDLENHVYKHGVRPPAVAAEWGRQIAGGLHAAHTAGLVHRDLKPSNILLTEGLQAMITDFGLARELTSTLTRHGRLVGTLEFMSPEQVADAPTCGPPADVYALGATLFWVLTGMLPMDKARTLAQAAALLRTGGAKRLREVAPDLPVRLADLVDRMLLRNPADRPTAAEVVQALGPLAAGSVLAATAAPAAGSPAEADRLRAVVAQLEQTVKARANAADQVRKGLVAGLAAAAAARPGEPPGHQQRVTAYTRALGAKLAAQPEWGMLADPAYLDEVARAAAAHDLGLVAVPDRLLVAPPETPADEAAFNAHPRLGADLLFAVAQAVGSTLPGLRTLRAVVRNHHERWDGAGFPDRLAGADIPPVARLVAVAVAYDDHRRGPDACTHQQAVGLIQYDIGRAFDPQVVGALAEVAGEFERVYAVVPDRDSGPAAAALPEPPPSTPISTLQRSLSTSWLRRSTKPPEGAG